MGGPETAGMAQDIREHMQTAADSLSEFATVAKDITSNVVKTVNAALTFF